MQALLNAKDELHDLTPVPGPGAAAAAEATLPVDTSAPAAGLDQETETVLDFGATPFSCRVQTSSLHPVAGRSTMCCLHHSRGHADMRSSCCRRAQPAYLALLLVLLSSVQVYKVHSSWCEWHQSEVLVYKSCFSDVAGPEPDHSQEGSMRQPAFVQSLV